MQFLEGIESSYFLFFKIPLDTGFGRKLLEIVSELPTNNI